MRKENNIMDQVLDLANQKCQDRYLMTLYEKCGLKVSDDDTLKRMLPLEETRAALSKGTIDFLNNLPKVSDRITREILGVQSPLIGAAAGAPEAGAPRRKEVEDMLRQLFTNPQLFDAYGKVQEHLEDGGSDLRTAVEELLLLLDL